MNKKPSRETIKSLIVAILHIQNDFISIGDTIGDKILASQNNKALEPFKNALYFAWEKYKYGWHRDFVQGGDKMIDYMIFELHARETIRKLIELLIDDSPFKDIESSSEITKGLLSVYRDIAERIDTGEITGDT